MTDLDQLGRRHAEKVRAVLADTEPPPLSSLTSSDTRRTWGGIWKAFAAVAVVAAAVLPVALLRDGSDLGEQPRATSESVAPTIAVPNLLRLTLAEARDAAEDAGLTLASEPSDQDAGRRVVSQEPAPGTRVARGSTVQVSLGEEESSPPAFVPPARTSDDRTVVPVVFPDGTRVEVSYRAGLDLTSGGLTPYSSGRIPGFSRDFWVRYGAVEDLAAEHGWQLLDTYADEDGDPVWFYRLPSDSEVDYLAFQFGPWTVLVYDYRTGAAGPRMSDDDRALWARSLEGAVTEEGFLVLKATPPLELADAGQHAGPQVAMHGSDGRLVLYLEGCGRAASPERTDEYVSWCDEQSGIRIMAHGSPTFLDEIVEDLAIRR